MKHRSGMTFIEIIISMALLGIICVTFLSSFAHHFKFLTQTKELTQDAFHAQEEIEKNIEILKEQLSKSTPSIPSDVKIFEKTLFSNRGSFRRSIKGYISRYSKSEDDAKQLITIVADGRLPTYPVPEVTNINLRLVRNGNTSNDIMDNYESVKYDDLSLKANVSMDENGVYGTSRHEWFVSNAGFNIPVIPTSHPNYNSLVKELDYGRLYPLFPNDYHPVPIKAVTDASFQSILEYLTETYAGRHIIYQITPFALSGRKGISVFSNPIFLTGPPVSDGKILHLDASLISKADTSSLTQYNDKLLVNSWKDQSSLHNNAAQNNILIMPELMEVNYHDSLSVWGKSLISQEIGSSMSISPFNSNGAMQDFVVILVAKRTSSNPSDVIAAEYNSNKIWTVGFDSDNLVFNASYLDSTKIPATRNLSVDDKFHIFTIKVTSDGTSNIFVDDETDATGAGTHPNTMPVNKLVIDVSNTEIAEILIYKNLSSSNLNTVRSFLMSKYNPDPAEGPVRINNLKPVEPVYILKGDTGYRLPGSIEAWMSNGTTQLVAIEWDDNIDTNQVGTKIITGRAILDPSKTVTLTVHVVEIRELLLDPNNITIYQTQDWRLPSQLEAIVGNSTISKMMKVNVIWRDESGEPLSNLNILPASGESPHVIKAYAEVDPSKYVDMFVYVLPYVKVQNIDILQDNIYLIKGDVLQLSIVVAPSNATYPEVEWSVIPSGIIDVDLNGNVKAIKAGSATIRVTSNDPNISESERPYDECRVTVYNESLDEILARIGLTIQNSNGPYDIPLGLGESKDDPIVSVPSVEGVVFSFVKPVTDTYVKIENGGKSIRVNRDDNNEIKREITLRATRDGVSSECIFEITIPKQKYSYILFFKYKDRSDNVTIRKKQ